MPQPAPGTGNESFVAKRKRGGESSMPAGPSAALRALPLELVPLVAPFNKDGQLSLRIENMHRLARLSKGRNNGDHSWSLTPGELDDLCYLLPETVHETHRLAIRVIDIGGGAYSTLTVLDYQVTPGPADRNGEVDERKFASLDASLVLTKEEARLLRRPEARSPERAAFGKAERSEIGVAAPLPRMFAGKGEAQPSSDSPARDCAPAETDGSARDTGKDVEARRLRDECISLQRTLAQRESDLAQAHAAARQALENAQQEKDTALSRAAQEWKAGEAVRLAAAEAQWLEQSNAALAVASAAAEARDDTAEESRRLREDCARMQTALSARDAQLAQLRKDSEQARADALSQAETAWRSAEAARLAAAQAQWRQQADAALAEAAAAAAARDSTTEETLRLREDGARMRTDLKAREAELAQLRKDGEKTREDALFRAEAVWKAGEAARLAAAQAQWQEQANAALAEASAAAGARENAAEDLGRMRDACARMQTALSERDAELAQLRSAAEQARKDALSRAEHAWKAGEAERLAAAQAQWREQSQAAFAVASAEGDAARDRAEDEVSRLREACTAMQATLGIRDAELAESRKTAEQARDDALAEAERAWKSAEAARLATAQAQWREQSQAALPDAGSEDVGRGHYEEELRRLRAECAGMQAALSERDGQLAQLRSDTRQARDEWQRQSAAGLVQAEKAWKSGEAARIAAAEAQSRNRYARELREATARFESAETALAQLRVRGETARRADAAEIARLRDELNAARATDVRHEPEPGYARAGITPLHARPDVEATLVLSPGQVRAIAGMAEQQRRANKKRSVWRDAAIAASLVVAAILSYPSLRPLLPESWTPTIAAATAGLGAGARAEAVSPPAPQNTALVVRGVNMRAGPSTAAPVIATLQRGQQVTAAETRGNWTLIRLAADGAAAPREGWVYSSFLDVTTRAAPAPLAPG